MTGVAERAFLALRRPPPRRINIHFSRSTCSAYPGASISDRLYQVEENSSKNANEIGPSAADKMRRPVKRNYIRVIKNAAVEMFD